MPNLQFPDDSCWVAHGHRVGFDVFCHNTSGSYHTTITNSNSGTYDGSASYPAILAYSYRIGIFLAFSARNIVERVVGSIDFYIWTYQSVCTDCDIGSIKESTIGIYKDMFPDA